MGWLIPLVLVLAMSVASACVSNPTPHPVDHDTESDPTRNEVPGETDHTPPITQDNDGALHDDVTTPTSGVADSAAGGDGEFYDDNDTVTDDGATQGAEGGPHGDGDGDLPDAGPAPSEWVFGCDD